MAHSSEPDFGDFEDSCGEMDDFGMATSFVRSCPGTFSDADLLFFYARYKQASEGPCAVPKPGFLDFAGRKKWEAWKSLGGMDPPTAKKQYVDKLTILKPQWLPKDGKPVIKGGGGMQVKVSRLAADPKEVDVETSLKTSCDYVKAGNIEALRTWLTQNPSEVNTIDASDEGKMSPLHWACDRGNQGIAALLLSFPGVNVNSRDVSGQTPLHFAVSCDYLECVRLLLQTPGIDCCIEDDDGNQPFDVAVSEEVRSLLRSHAPTST